MKTGVIGLGAMGTGMALNLHKAGHLHRVWNRTRDKAVQFSADTGVKAADSAKTLAADCELILISVSRDQDVLEVIDKIAGAVRPGSTVVDTSTVSSATARLAAERIKAQDCSFLDCPVTGGVEGARNGTLSLMAGGKETELDRIRNILSAIAKRIVYIGPSGSGQACKAVNQIICAGINQAVTEGLAFGEAAGLDMDKVLEAVAGGAAGNWFMDHRGRSMLAGRYDPGFKLNLHHKDLKICLDMAGYNADKRLPVVARTVAD
jgi:3-hydroxyisobutyrate dehydrogenase